MKYLRLFEHFLDEALDLPTARKLTKIFLDSGGKKRYQEIFGDKDRLYYDFIPEDEGKDLSPLALKVDQELRTRGFSLLSYKDGTAKKDGDKKNTFKVQKLLTKWGLEDLKNLMDKDPERSLAKHSDKKIVISRHGIDIGGASTNRPWTSCLSLVAGINARYIPTMIEAGALIAYLIDAEDTNINKPLGRIKILPFINTEDPTQFLMYTDTQVYGNYRDKGFMEFVEKWCMEFNAKYNPSAGEYRLDSKCHSDGRSGIYYGDTLNLSKGIKNRSYNLEGSSIVRLNSNYSFDDFYENVVKEGVSDWELEKYIKYINDRFPSLVIDYINGEENTKTKNFIQQHLKLMNSVLKSLGEGIFKINTEKTRLIIEEILKALPLQVKQFIFSERKNLQTKENLYFLQWMREKGIELGLADAEFPR